MKHYITPQVEAMPIKATMELLSGSCPTPGPDMINLVVVPHGTSSITAD